MQGCNMSAISVLQEAVRDVLAFYLVCKELPPGNQSNNPRGLGQSPSTTISYSANVLGVDKFPIADIDSILLVIT